jgi:predicted HTH transcriptional regulator
MYPSGFLELCIKAIKDGPQEFTINALLNELQLTNNALSSIKMFEEGFRQYDLEIFPPFIEGSFDDTRILKLKQISTSFDNEELLELIEQGESYSSELKSTFLLDLKRKQFDPNASINDLRSEEVTISAMKTIAGFLNWEGGKLIIGVEDNGNCIGIENDYCFFKESQRNLDGWELEFRNQIKSKFYDGNAVNQHINIKFCRVENVTIAIVIVFARRKMSFVKKSQQSDYVLYSRVGNSTFQIPITEIEEFIQRRKDSLRQ